MTNSTCFPGDEFEALAYLYVQSQESKDKTPEEILHMYLDARKALKKEYSAMLPNLFSIDEQKT